MTPETAHLKVRASPLMPNVCTLFMDSGEIRECLVRRSANAVAQAKVDGRDDPSRCALAGRGVPQKAKMEEQSRQLVENKE